VNYFSYGLWGLELAIATCLWRLKKLISILIHLSRFYIVNSRQAENCMYHYPNKYVLLMHVQSRIIHSFSNKEESTYSLVEKLDEQKFVSIH